MYSNSISKLLLFTAAILTTINIAFSAIRRCPDCAANPIPYPLSTGPDCGDQSYKIRCDAGSLKLDTLNNTYSIISINPAIQRLVIRPSDFIPNTCVTSDITHGGIKLNSSLPFNVTSSNTILYFNCTDSLLRSPLDCSSTSLCHTYVNATRSVAPCADAPLCCAFRTGGSSTAYMIRVREAGCSAYTSFVNLNPDSPIDRWHEPGLELEWKSPREPKCKVLLDDSECDGNSTCREDIGEAGSYRCFCDAGFVWDGFNGVCSKVVESSTLKALGEEVVG